MPPRPQDKWDQWAESSLERRERTSRRLFLGREIYRRRRIMDAARLLPVFGTVLFLMPILWAVERGTAAGVVYLFSVWLGLILAAAFLSVRLAEPLEEHGQAEADEGEEP
ncbi:hypothetical protein [Tropicimonas sp.]|uniref:hypothetical protein n=1 Tax=Tropicimonas sp. TaxID=2067044 RepID=UPI003A85EE22